MDTFRYRSVSTDVIIEAIEYLVPEHEEKQVRNDLGRPEVLFDRNAFADRMLGDTELAQEVVDLFLAYEPELMSTIRRALAQKDAKGLTNAVYSLKGSVANLGAQGVLELALELEVLTRQNDLKRAQALFPALDKEVTRLRQAVSAFGGKTRIRRVLVADDDPISRRVLQVTLTKWGYDPVVCGDGAEALKIIERPDRPELAILDWMMPGLDGIQVVRALRKRTAEPYMYVVMLTGKDRSTEIIEALDAGADDYMTKPFDPRALKARLRAGERLLDSKAGAVTGPVVGTVGATYDPLTGALSHETILVTLKREIGLARLNKTSVGVIMAAPTRWGNIVARHGRKTAETVLQQIAQRIQTSVGYKGHVGRYANERFLVAVPNCEMSMLEGLAKQVKESAEWPPLDVENVLYLTMALGLTLAPGSPRTDLESVLPAVEKALEAAQRLAGKETAFEPVAFKPGASPVAGLDQRPAGADRLDRELVLASGTGDLHRVTYLLQKGADVNATDKRGNTPLMEAAFWKYPEVVNLLLEKGADFRLTNNEGDTVLTVAIKAGHTEVVKLVLAKVTRTDIEKGLGGLYKALVHASTYGKMEVVSAVTAYLKVQGISVRKPTSG